MSGPTVKAIGVLLLTGFFAALVGLLYSTGSSDSGAQDQQPVAFTHARHAGDLHINCLYCHRSATASTTAGVPSVHLCMSCHQNLARDKPETLKLMAYWEDQQPIEWVRLHRLPDFVYFTHEMHLRSGLECVTCHGHVDQMPSTPRAASFEMGWCISCHEARGVSRDCWTCHK
ncbi:MAG TPA: cytochrome c3 family protein [Nitrospira sp.]